MKTAFLGLGAIGRPMAARIAAAGLPLTVWNRTADRAAAFSGETGGRVRHALSPADAVRDAEVVITCFPESKHVQALLDGPDGLIAGLQRGATLVDCTSGDPATSRAIAKTLDFHGVGFLDAPVTGSKAQAESGTLAFLVGGRAELLERARPALIAMSGSIAHLGPSGSGATMKLINNFLCGVQVASLAEALAMAERSGLDARQAAAVLGAGSPGSPLVKIVAQRMLDRVYEPNFFVPLMAKDLAYARQAFARAGLELKSADVAREAFLAAERAGFGEEDIASIVELLRR